MCEFGIFWLQNCSASHTGRNSTPLDDTGMAEFLNLAGLFLVLLGQVQVKSQVLKAKLSSSNCKSAVMDWLPGDRNSVAHNSE